MNFELKKESAEKYFFNALCNGLGYFESYGIELQYSDEEYKEARKTAKSEDEESVSYEDVLMQMLKNGNTLFAEDFEAEETYSLNLEKMYAQMNQVPEKFILQMIAETDDADTADVILQVCFIGEIIYG
jgi:hypothetical protein